METNSGGSGSKKEPAKKPHLLIGILEELQMKSLIVLLFLLAGLPLWATIDAGGVVIAASPAGIFQEGELLRFTLKPEAGNNVRYTIRDWNGSKVAEGGWPVEGLTLSALPRG